ncbi:MAG: hypothetical protein EOQ28_20845 [Mesorhizobium sp.]|uniref:hypothetical protein n=1 Tax=Mesorhizobium sp. TaxID=1871066 RepID=UPI000FEA05F6|nr:hypothetical protein [Mesorhizobium sp.]RWA70457.1 MAG: hypothetical protein EOQ28_20845 [Mesorhizobium sp.]RWB96321.1 MAG: hypothetical protein EOQ57_27315 [Mesorhizobium sp.]RWK06698.1 MAG: hypothetical protein EOR39_24035 [Mesorhizobium sp.]
MPNNTVPAAGEAMPTAIIGRFSGHAIITGVDEMADAARQIERKCGLDRSRAVDHPRRGIPR